MESYSSYWQLCELPYFVVFGVSQIGIFQCNPIQGYNSQSSIQREQFTSLFQAPREKREGEDEGTKTRGTSPPRFRPLVLSFALLSRSLEQASNLHVDNSFLRYSSPITLQDCQAVRYFFFFNNIWSIRECHVRGAVYINLTHKMPIEKIVLSKFYAVSGAA